MLAKMIGGEVEVFVEANDLISGGCPYKLWNQIEERFHSTSFLRRESPMIDIVYKLWV